VGAYARGDFAASRSLEPRIAHYIVLMVYVCQRDVYPGVALLSVSALILPTKAG